MSVRVALSTRTTETDLVGTLDGIGVYTQALVQHLPRLDIDVTGFVFAKPDERKHLRASLPLPCSYRRALLSTLLPLPAAVSLPVDVWHFTDHRVVRARQPSIATVHDAIPLKFPEWMPARLRWLKNDLMRRSIATADRFVAVSEYAVTELVDYYRLAPDRISVIPNGIDEAWLQPIAANADQLRRQWGIPQKPYFLFVGTFQPRKNLRRILDAYAQLPDTERRETALVVVGRAGWNCEDDLARLRALQARGEDILWVEGLQDREALRAIYAGAQALVFTTLYEGFGLPILEGFASATPVITSQVASMPEVAGDAALLVDPYDTAAISDAMLRLLRDPQLAEDLRGRGRLRVTRYRWSETASQLAALYREMAAAAT